MSPLTATPCPATRFKSAARRGTESPRPSQAILQVALFVGVELLLASAAKAVGVLA